MQLKTDTHKISSSAKSQQSWNSLYVWWWGRKRQVKIILAIFLHGKNTTKTARIRYQLMMHTLMKTAQKGKKTQPTNVVWKRLFLPPCSPRRHQFITPNDAHMHITYPKVQTQWTPHLFVCVFVWQWTLLSTSIINHFFHHSSWLVLWVTCLFYSYSIHIICNFA